MLYKILPNVLAELRNRGIEDINSAQNQGTLSQSEVAAEVDVFSAQQQP
ncbi:MAG: hypothetical protein AB4040_21525 [Synechococcus sp.]